MKKVLLIFSGIIILLFLVGCTQQIACTEDARMCPDGSAVVRIPPDCEFEECPEGNGKVFCEAYQREGEFCIAQYEPVCGWKDPEKTQCIKYPCASTYSNSCFACQDPNVLYWTLGECPN